MYGGIDQLVNTFKGNPQPLAQKVQRDQQGQPPGAIPPDLEAALALQQIAELRQGAQNQQAMQAGGAQPTVVQKLHQMLGAQQAQAQAPQMQGQPVMAASGGSITQLMSNLGQNYAGGGIVAFSKPTEENNRSLVNDPEADSSQFAQDIAKIPQAFDDWKQRAREQDAIDAAQNQRMEKYRQDKLAAQQKTSLFNYLFGTPTQEKEGQAKLAELSAAPVTSVATPAAPDAETEKLKRLAAARAQTGQSANPALVPKPPVDNIPAAPRPNINPGIGGGPAKPTAETMDPMEKAIRDSVMKAMGQDPEEARRKAIEANAKAMGLDALLKPAQDRAAAREARIKEIQAGRQPLWIDALMSANKPTKSGIAGVLQNMAVGANATKQNYDVEDLRFIDELNKLHEGIDKAKIEGRYKDVAAGEAAVKDLISSQRQAEQSGTSLLNKQATLAQTKQIADDNRKSREMIAASNLEATKAKRLQDQSNFLATLQVKHEALLNKDPEWEKMSKMKSMIELQMTVITDEAKRAKVADQLEAQQAKMAAYAANKIGGGMAGAGNIPPPPQGAVREVKKS